VFVDERVHTLVRVAVPRDAACVIDDFCAIVFKVSKGAQVARRSVAKQNQVTAGSESGAAIRCANNFSVVADVHCPAAPTGAEHTELGQRPVFVDKTPARATGECDLARNNTAGIDALAERAGTEIDHVATTVEKSMKLFGRRDCQPGDLARIIDRARRAVGAAEGAEVGDDAAGIHRGMRFSFVSSDRACHLSPVVDRLLIGC